MGLMMAFDWTIFENLKEFVYVTNIEDDSLVYINAYLREKLGLSEEDYLGKKCYKLLQGKDRVCDFCTNCKLSENNFHEWTSINPQLNQKLFIKDTLIVEDGKKYRLEIAIEVGSSDNKNDSQYNAYHLKQVDHIISQCAKNVYYTPNPNDAIERFLEYIGRYFECDRSYIFEFSDHDTSDNTYEWCKDESISKQKDLLQNVPNKAIEYWLDSFKNKEIIKIKNLDDIKEKYAITYAFLKDQDIHSLIVAPIYDNKNKLLGFYGIDNPSINKFELLASMFGLLAEFLCNSLARRDVIKRLEVLSFYDPLTGAYNRHALFEFIQKNTHINGVGIIYCDISGLKNVNDNFGHEEGDKLILNSYKLIRENAKKYKIYRIGGDEFTVIFDNITFEKFVEYVDKLKKAVSQSNFHIAVGHAYCKEPPINYEEMIELADKAMYKDKRDYYCRSDAITGETHDRRRNHYNEVRSQLYNTVDRNNSLFYKFIENNFFDPESLVYSITKITSSNYIYFGDVQKDLYYISDNLRDKFGFDSNIVASMINVWYQKICTEDDKYRFQKDIKRLLEDPDHIHNLRYQVYSKEGKPTWVHCVGRLEWNKERTKPLFFSGIITSQDENFVVDSITNLPREYALVAKINEYIKKTTKIQAIGFKFNHFTAINSIKGRHVGNFLLQNICLKLTKYFSNELHFYRLDGISFAAIIKPTVQTNFSEFIEKIREITNIEYNKVDVNFKNNVSFCVLSYPQDFDSGTNLIEYSMTLCALAAKRPDEPYVLCTKKNLNHLKDSAKMSMALATDIQNHMTNFNLVVQPIVKATDKGVYIAEATLLWQFNDKKIACKDFMRTISQEKLVTPVTKWLLERVVTSCKRYLIYQENFVLAFNINYSQILSDDLIPYIKKLLERYRISGSHFIIEIAETNIHHGLDKFKAFIEGCLELDIKIAIDDFGNGASSLNLLINYPSSYVKIDNALLKGISTLEDKASFIRSIVYSCHQFDKLVCVEGINTQEDRDMVITTGCDFVQGDYYYKSMEEQDLYKIFLNKNF